MAIYNHSSLQIIHFESFTEQRYAGHTTEWRSLPFSVLEFSPDGSWELQTEGKKPCLTKAGELFFIPAGRRHCLTIAPRITHMKTCWTYLHVTAHGREDILLGASGGSLLPSSVSGKCRELIESNLRLADTPGLRKYLLKNSLAYQVLAKILPYCDLPEESAGGNRERLQPVLNHIDRHYAEALERRQLARLAGMSMPRLHAVFKEEMGVSPWHYVLQRRIRAAQNLLISSDRQIGEIAERCGFNSTYYFSRLFTQYVGQAPTAYRSSIQIAG